MNSSLAIRALGALAHPSRLSVFRLLVQAGPDGVAAGIVAEQLGIAPNALTFHLKYLAQAELVALRYQGRRIFYSTRSQTMNALVGYLTENCCQGVSCSFASLAQVACCN